MSGAVRSQPRRSAARSAASLPYARPKQPPQKKSPWSIATGLLNYFNPLRLRSESPSSPIDVDDDDEPDVDNASDDDSPPESLSARGRQMASTLVAPPPQPPQTPHQQHPTDPVTYQLPDSSSPQQNLDAVVSFLDQRRGQTISPLEAEGLISLINKSTPPEKPEPFRFSTSASLPSTPARGNSPAGPNDLFTLGASSSTSALNGSPRKTLSKNPNGVYRWSGGGSARASKNRYASPAFGTPSRAKSEHLVFRDSPAQNNASPKRRRVETTPPAATPPPAPRSAGPGPSPTRVAASQYFPFPVSTPASSPAAGPNASPATPALAPAPATTTPTRAALTMVKSLPVHPSPLRQAWGGSPASSVSSGGSSPAQGTPTKAATLLTALIRDADADAPKRSAAVRNPYQSASPVGVRVTNTHPPEAAGRKRTRATGRPAAREAERLKKRREEKEAREKEQEERERKEKEVVPPQAIIEATLPKGSKRSRPPANFNANASLNSLAAPPAPSTRRSPRLEPQRLEADDEAKEKDTEEKEAGAPAAKRARLPAVNGSAPASENGGLLMATELAPAPAPCARFPAAVRFPRLRLRLGAVRLQQWKWEWNASTPFEFRMGPKPLASAPKEPSKLRYSFAPPTPPPVADKETAPTVETKRLFPMAPPPPPSKSELPAFSAPAPAAKFKFSSGAQDPKDAARALPVTALPSFVFAVLTNTLAPAPGAADKARDAARRLDKSKLPVFDLSCLCLRLQGFNWAAAGAKPPAPVHAPGSWTCGTCMLVNGPEATEKCAVCDAKAPGAAAAPAPKGFNWAAAGAKPPTPAHAPGSWTCGTCMLMNGPEATEKCAVCDAKAPSVAAAPAPKGFNWAAAGAAAPSKPAGWTCGTCMLTNGPEATEKCAVCDAPR
ncbi:hypothetical protein FB451DRAFT_1499353 [Mycena latifolia]|nr:hypothetical protein FB451DRAFT_1499353 [Mycena latifolia]